MVSSRFCHQHFSFAQFFCSTLSAKLRGPQQVNVGDGGGVAVAVFAPDRILSAVSSQSIQLFLVVAGCRVAAAATGRPALPGAQATTASLALQPAWPKWRRVSHCARGKVQKTNS